MKKPVDLNALDQELKDICAKLCGLAPGNFEKIGMLASVGKTDVVQCRIYYMIQDEKVWEANLIEKDWPHEELRLLKKKFSLLTNSVFSYIIVHIYSTGKFDIEFGYEDIVLLSDLRDKSKNF